jgi:hypothetical protein
MTPRITAATPVEQWPLRLTVQEVALVLGRSAHALQNSIHAAWPPPVRDDHGIVKPIRFDKRVVAAYINGELPRPQRRRLTPRTFRRVS